MRCETDRNFYLINKNQNTKLCTSGHGRVIDFRFTCRQTKPYNWAKYMTSLFSIIRLQIGLKSRQKESTWGECHFSPGFLSESSFPSWSRELRPEKNAMVLLSWGGRNWRAERGGGWNLLSRISRKVGTTQRNRYRLSPWVPGGSWAAHVQGKIL